MKLVRLRGPLGPTYGEIVDGEVWLLEGSLVTGFRRTQRHGPLASAVLLAPVEPSKVVAVATNYPAHAAEMGKAIPDEPRIFIKPSTAVIGPGEPIRIPPGTARVDPECELGVVIGRTLSRATPEAAMQAVFGYTAVNDVTARDLQKKDGIFGRAKGFDTFCPIGPWVDTGLDARDLAVSTVVNGDVRAHGRTSEMHFDVPTLLSFISNVMTLLPGDVIATGTPPGVAPIVDGDVVVVRIEGLGDLSNPVVHREDRVG